MSRAKDSQGRYRSSTDRRTDTPGVYERVNSKGESYYRVLSRPDGKLKVMTKFSSYEEACEFKRVHTPDRKTPKVRAKRVPTSVMSFILADPCVYCGGPSQSFDHIVPKCAGGEHHWTNLASACLSCNASKGKRSLLHFLLERLDPPAKPFKPKHFEDDSIKPLFDLLGI